MQNSGGGGGGGGGGCVGWSDRSASNNRRPLLRVFIESLLILYARKHRFQFVCTHTAIKPYLHLYIYNTYTGPVLLSTHRTTYIFTRPSLLLAACYVSRCL